MPAPLSRPWGKQNSPRRRELIRLWRDLWRGCFDQYRPERHYMRGPGPRWHQKHGQHFA